GAEPPQAGSARLRVLCNREERVRPPVVLGSHLFCALAHTVRWRTERRRCTAYSGSVSPRAIPRKPKSHPANQLLAALPSKTYQRLVSGLERVDLKFRDVLYQPGDPTEHVYFPNDSMLSLLVAVEGNGALEV